MTAYAQPQGTSRRSSAWPMYAALGAGIALVLVAVGTFWDLTGNDTGSNENTLGEFAIVLGIVAVATAVVYGLVVRTAASGNADRRALVLSVLSVLSVVVFWSGLPTLLGVAAFACVAAGRPVQGVGLMGKVAVGISALMIAASVFLAIAG